MKSIQKYLKQKTADGTVFKIAAATFVLFNFAYLILPISSHLIGKKSGLDFFRDLTDPRTYLYIIASSIILAALVSSLVFYKAKTKCFKYGDNYDFDDKVEELLLDDAEKKDKIQKVTISLGHNGVMIMPNENVIEIPVLHYDTAD